MREGRRLLEGDLVEMGLFLLPCHDGSGKTEQGWEGKLTQEKDHI